MGPMGIISTKYGHTEFVAHNSVCTPPLNYTVGEEICTENESSKLLYVVLKFQLKITLILVTSNLYFITYYLNNCLTVSYTTVLLPLLLANLNNCLPVS